MSLNAIAAPRCVRLDSWCQWRHQRWFILIAALVELFWFSGYHYGYNALIDPFKQIGVFRYACNASEENCPLQEKLFHYAFLVWVIVQMCLITGAGIIMDRFGLRLLKLLAVGIYFVGTLMFAFTKGESSNLLFVAGIFVALGCVSSLICNHQISSMFPEFRGFTISLMSGAFDSSTVVTFLITKTFPSISLQTSFVVVACCALFYGTMMGLFGLTQWSEDMSNRGMKVDVDDTVERQVDKHRNGDDELEGNVKYNVDERIQAILESRYPSLRRCIFSWPFFLVTLWFMFGMLRFSYFLNQMEYRLNGNKYLPQTSIEFLGQNARHKSSILAAY
ncbi:hypothetical protein P879_02919 [Paragonimus westermani]|uniref:Solute carrier family 43 member 3 n=1 Tax=Paragonimus westermani TaxID=34504 RepID=A0A8T0DVP8_9TREM|nr:hypothetical protein P879_02919 [Paragonimus westermani]